MQREPEGWSAGAAVSSSLVGALCGVVMAAFGSVISGSPAAVAVTLAAGVLLGAFTARAAGAAAGFLLAALAILGGWVVGGTPWGVALTITTSAVLAGCLRWRQLHHHAKCAAPCCARVTVPMRETICPSAIREAVL